MNQEEFKDELRRLVAANRLEDASKKLLNATASDDYGEYRRLVLNHSGELTGYHQQEVMGTADPAQLTRTRNAISLKLLTLIDQLPDAAALAAAKKKPEGVAEDRLKKRLFWMLLLGKGLVIGFAALLWSTNSFTNEQFITVVGMLVPLFAAHLTLMVQDATKHRGILKPGDKRVNTSFARMAYVLVIGYALVLLFLLNLRGPGTITFLQFTTFLALAESGLGAYLGKVVYGLFKD
ncbi:hypothetical protein [Lewinella sp. W8]|uniref:hypothetical protein n=1 Tax=Lewinella sp. W8 TaxID=2528208 RepID=UPI001067AB44|nr:hypothetical protein [Lewinella sp. W8]MTB52771.1 hypothetical protein [Lewinella sp. W8]